MFQLLSDINQKRIVEEGGLDALLMLFRSSENTTILVAFGAIANLAVNGNFAAFSSFLRIINFAYEYVDKIACL